MNTDEFSLRRALEVMRGNRTLALADCTDDVVETELGADELLKLGQPTTVELIKMAREFL